MAPSQTVMVRPAPRVRGRVRPPGDKSISHRYALFSALADGTSTIAGYSTGADCASTLACLGALGVQVEQTGRDASGLQLRITGRGLGGLSPAAAMAQLPSFQRSERPARLPAEGTPANPVSGVAWAAGEQGGEGALRQSPLADPNLSDEGVGGSARPGHAPPPGASAHNRDRDGTECCGCGREEERAASRHRSHLRSRTRQTETVGGIDRDAMESVQDEIDEALGHAAHEHRLCVGGGLELSSACDMRYCTEDSRFGIPVKRLGLVVAYAELLPLVRLVGSANAKEILLEGRVFDAARAREMGLVNRVLPRDGFEAAIEEIAAAIAEGAPLVARWHKKFVDRLTDPTPLSAEEADESYHCFDTEDFLIGTEAFRSKTQPVFKGR